MMQFHLMQPFVAGDEVSRRRLIPTAVGALMATLLVLASSAAAHPRRAHQADRDGGNRVSTSAVAQNWYDITDRTITAAAYPEPVTQSRAWSVSWLAATRAVGDRRDRSYAVSAFAQALHDTLAAQVPTQQGQLDADLAQTLADVPNGPAKSAGILSGRHQAQAVLAERQSDGLDTASVDTPFTPPAAGPGVWQPTPPTFAAALRCGCLARADAIPKPCAANWWPRG